MSLQSKHRGKPGAQLVADIRKRLKAYDRFVRSISGSWHS
jgi:hypothetical protein